MPTEFNGSLVIYHRIIRPYYMKHHDRIDTIASSGKKYIYFFISESLYLAKVQKHKKKQVDTYSRPVPYDSGTVIKNPVLRPIV